jgi:hypothetical protein
MSEIWIAAAAAVVVGGSTYMSKKKGAKAPGQADPVNLSDASKEALRINRRDAPEIEDLISRSNNFMQDQSLSLLNRSVPGYNEIAGNLVNQAKQASANPYALPQEFEDNLSRIAAERGINTGVRGQAGDFSLLRDFGVNSLQYGQQQLANSQSILSTLAGLSRVNPLSPLSMYVTPQNALQVASENRSADQAQLNAQQAAANQKASAPWDALAAGAGVFGGIYGGGAGRAASAGATYSGTAPYSGFSDPPPAVRGGYGGTGAAMPYSTGYGGGSGLYS